MPEEIQNRESPGSDGERKEKIDFCWEWWHLSSAGREIVLDSEGKRGHCNQGTYWGQAEFRRRKGADEKVADEMHWEQLPHAQISSLVSLSNMVLGKSGRTVKEGLAYPGPRSLWQGARDAMLCKEKGH